MCAGLIWTRDVLLLDFVSPTMEATIDMLTCVQGAAMTVCLLPANSPCCPK